MNKYLTFLVFGAVVLSICVLAYAINGAKESTEQYNSIARSAVIRPDYSGMVIPANIAPLNFSVREKGSDYRVKIYSEQGRPIEIFSKLPKIIIPKSPWRKLLNENKGQELYFDIFVKTEGQWNRFSAITNKIADEQIDGYLAYRKIHPGHSTWRNMGIYQRNLQNYDESTILNNRTDMSTCLNCHTFRNNHTDKMTLGVRSSEYGSSALLAVDGEVVKIGTKFGYTSWHPTGRIVLYSVSKTNQFYHSTKNEIRDVIDMDSMLAYYSLDNKTVKTTPELSGKGRLETYPTWSPDGKYLYFCSAPKLWSDINEIPPARYDQVKYDLVRISYDIENDQWGELETVLSAKDTGLSILEPRISPDGRWLLFCMCNYGCFPVYQQSSDLYLMDLKAAQQTGRYEYRRLNINSDESESWHSWSSNGRWIAFSSKKGTYVFTRIYLSYVDHNGKVYKPLVVPQKDPTFYDSCLTTYSVPELTIDPVQTRAAELGWALRSSRKISPDLPITMATPGAEATGPWKERE